MRNYDVVVFRTNSIYQLDSPVITEPSIRERLELGHGLRVQRLPHAVSDAIARACNAGGVGNATPQRYAFVREYSSGDVIKDFDEDERLRIAIALSRLVRPTSVGLEESAQVEGDLEADRRPENVRPGPVQGPAAQAWVTDGSQRDWLTRAEGEELARLLATYFSRPISSLIRRALWFHEFAANTLDGAVRWTLIVTGLEALVNTEDLFITRQFAERTTAIAAECNVPLTTRDAKTSYSMRSRVAHGKVTGFSPDRLELFIRTERVLRVTLKRIFSDPAFAAKFETEDAVRSQWPVAVDRLCATCGQERPPPDHSTPE